MTILVLICTQFEQICPDFTPIVENGSYFQKILLVLFAILLIFLLLLFDSVNNSSNKPLTII